MGSGLSSLGCNHLGTGTKQEVFHGVGILSRLRIRLKMCRTTPHSWSAQSLSSLKLIPSGPAVFLTRTLLSSLLTWEEETQPDGGGLFSNHWCVNGLEVNQVVF